MSGQVLTVGEGERRRLTRDMAKQMVVALLRPGGGFTREQVIAHVKERTGFDLSSDFATQEETPAQALERFRREVAGDHATALFYSTDGKRIHAVAVARPDEQRFVEPKRYWEK